MGKPKQPSQFAPAQRASDETVLRQTKLIKKASFPIKPLFEATTDIILILNEQRQIVHFNNNLLDLLKTSDENSIYGLRPGEVLHCIRSANKTGGCGTAEFCRTCGAANAILKSQLNFSDSQECRITTDKDYSALDLLVKATPLPLENELFTIFTVKDISHEKRRKILEKIFFHDILNTAACIQMAAELICPKNSDSTNETGQILLQGVSDLTEIVNNQKMLSSAESHELIASPAPLSSLNALGDVQKQFKSFAQTKQVALVIDPSSKDINCLADRTILLRVLGNMIKNAVEASSPENVVTIGAHNKNSVVEFFVHNQSAMDREIQLQIFQRSFSTKGSGRGLGTYSMKLLSERYLKGSVAFTSLPEKGTTFMVSIPLTVIH